MASLPMQLTHPLVSGLLTACWNPPACASMCSSVCWDPPAPHMDCLSQPSSLLQASALIAPDC